MRALVIGGGGYIGSRLVSRLVRENHDVTALMLPDASGTQERTQAGQRIVYADRHDPGLVRSLLRRDTDVVFDLIAYRPADTEALVIEGAGRLGRLVHLSSVSVYREFPTQGRVTEHNAKRFDGVSDDYSGGKAACELVLERAGAELGFPSVVLRSAPIFGQNDPCSRENFFLKRIIARRPILHPGPTRGMPWFLFIDDLVDAMMRAATASVIGQVFHLAHEDAPTLDEHIVTLARGVGMPAPELQWMTIERLSQLGFGIYGFPCVKTLEVRPDTSAARRSLGWHQRSYQQAIAALLDGLSPDVVMALPAWPGRNTMQARLSGTHEWLHEAREARVLRGVQQAPEPSVDQTLSWLADAPGQRDCPLLLEAERWLSVFSPHLTHNGAADGTDIPTSKCITVPRALLQRLASSWMSPPSAMFEPIGIDVGTHQLDLVAAVEYDKWDPNLAWVFGTPPRHALARYGLSDQPQAVRILPYPTGIAGGVPLAERLLLETYQDADVRALEDHLHYCENRGTLDVDDVASWARIYVLGAARWVPPAVTRALGIGNSAIQGASDWAQPQAAAWVLSHSVARLLCRAGLSGAARLRMGRPRGDHSGGEVLLPPAAAICELKDSIILADLASGRVVQVPEPVARLLTGYSQ
jgi:nucleoside-diphosphate-sugar epimerase